MTLVGIRLDASIENASLVFEDGELQLMSPEERIIELKQQMAEAK